MATPRADPVPTHHSLLRSGAQVGDLLCVSGPLGAAAAALPFVLGQVAADTVPAEAQQQLLAAYWTPQPQLELGRWLLGKASAALDISDGLLADCGHIAKASKVALQIEQARVPIAAAVLRAVGDADALQCALSGGDDYQLAFTIAASYLEALQQRFTAVQVIGRVSAGQGVQLLDSAGQSIKCAHLGYQHFQ